MTDDRLTHEDTRGVLLDLFERLGSAYGRLWFGGLKRWIRAKGPDFYVLDLGGHQTMRVLLDDMHRQHHAFVTMPASKVGFAISNNRPCLGRECLWMTSVRAMGFLSGATRDEIRHYGRLNGCVATSYEAGCKLLMEPIGKGLLRLAPSPIVWTFVGGNHRNRQNLFISDDEPPELVALASDDSHLSSNGIKEPKYVIGHDGENFAPSDMFIFSLEI
jgi:hypothetical protein